MENFPTIPFHHSVKGAISEFATSIKYKVECGSLESVYKYFKTIKLENHELNHFEDNRNTILDLF